MSFQSVKRKLVRDLKTSWKKTAALCVLLAIGFSLWIPQILSAVGGKSAKSVAAKPVHPPAPADNSKPAPNSATPAKNSRPHLTWQEAMKALQTNPLVQSAEVAAMPGNPFRVDRNQFPPPVLFAEPEPPKKKEPTQPTAKKVVVRSFENLKLKSTMIGLRRRAAVINSKFYLEGSELEFEGEFYRIQTVNPRNVTLRQGGQTWDIKIASAKVSRSIQVQRQSPMTEENQD